MAKPDKRKARVLLSNGMQLVTYEQGLETNSAVTEIKLTFAKNSEATELPIGLPMKAATELHELLQSATLEVQDKEGGNVSDKKEDAGEI